MLLRSTLILGTVLVAGSASASIAAGAKHSEHEKSYTRAPMRARSMAPRIESGAAATQNVKPFTIEEQRWFNQANGAKNDLDVKETVNLWAGSSAAVKSMLGRCWNECAKARDYLCLACRHAEPGWL